MAHNAHYNQMLRDVTIPALSNDISYDDVYVEYPKELMKRGVNMAV